MLRLHISSYTLIDIYACVYVCIISEGISGALQQMLLTLANICLQQLIVQ